MSISERLQNIAASYYSDARKFRDAGKTGTPILGEEKDAYFATMYFAISAELRKVGGQLTASPARVHPVSGESVRRVLRLVREPGADAVLTIDGVPQRMVRVKVTPGITELVYEEPARDE